MLYSQKKECVICRQLRPLPDFITGRNIHKQITYSEICEACRNHSEGAGRKEKRPTINHEDKTLAKENKQEKDRKKFNNKKQYFNKQSLKK